LVWARAVDVIVKPAVRAGLLFGGVGGITRGVIGEGEWEVVKCEWGGAGLVDEELVEEDPGGFAFAGVPGGEVFERGGEDFEATDGGGRKGDGVGG